MQVVRYADAGGEVHVGALDGDELRAAPGVRSLGELLGRDLADIEHALRNAAHRPATHARAEVTPLAPIDGRTELWAAGVTYRRSREARVEESTEKTVYEKVYDAERPELFFKAPAWRVVTDGEPITVRSDSPLNVPEPELAVVANAAGQPVGYLVANDVSSRSIEGENPLYLPQAKIYAGSAALSWGIRPFFELPEVAEKSALAIEMTMTRAGETVFAGTTSTTELHRSPAELLDWLYRGLPFPEGAVLCTGTGIVPGMDVTLRPGDQVRITIEEVGTLVNPVRAHPAGGGSG